MINSVIKLVSKANSDLVFILQDTVKFEDMREVLNLVEYLRQELDGNLNKESAFNVVLEL